MRASFSAVKPFHWALVAIVCVLLGAIAFLLAHPTIKIDKVVVIETTTTTIPLDASLPPHSTYAQVQDAVLASIDNWYASTVTVAKGISPYKSLDCALPKVWEVGAQFACVTSGSDGLTNGTATVIVQTTNAGAPFSIYTEFSPSS